MHTIVVDLSLGDCGKGKISDILADKHNHVVRYNGSSNAGHLITIGDQKIALHIVPCGIIKGIHSHIGRGCVVSPDKFKKEVEMLSSLGYNTKLITIDENTHLVTDEHIKIDNEREDINPIGSTRQGVSPAYEAKYGRRGIRVRDIKNSDPESWQFMKSFSVPSNFMVDKEKVLFESAQGALLDIDSDWYPYVTASSCTANAASNGVGIPLLNKKVEVIGVFKAYTTSVSKGPFPTSIEGESLADKIREIGNEFGTTTGRPRQIGWLDLFEVDKAAKLNGCTSLVVNKSDVLSGLGDISVRVDENDYKTFEGWDNLSSPNFDNFLDFIEKYTELPIFMVGTGPRRDQSVIRNDRYLESSNKEEFKNFLSERLLLNDLRVFEDSQGVLSFQGMGLFV